jgi:gamma-glutamylcyclotransferase (GGCT)/AIG2-like uncharacterized protein YtfP
LSLKRLDSHVSSTSFSVVGYGTFITHGHWRNKHNIEVCLVRNYIRIFPKGNWFPYVLPLKNSSFWALKFDVNEQELLELDKFEGVSAGLFKRVETEIILKSSEKEKAFIYIPTEKTINLQNLNAEIDKNDTWKEEIRKFPEIVDKFPELVS